MSERWLIGCEFSGVVRRAFRSRGIDAWSCDIRPAADGDPHHIQGDVLSAINQGWDGGIFHPPCTYLTIAAEWAYGNGPYHQKVKPETLVGEARREARREALVFFRALLDAPISKIAIENPVGVVSSAIRKPDQVVQPYQFGDDASKATCLWLVGLPKLRHTSSVEGRLVNGKRRWANQTDSGQNRLSPSADRAALRSTTYPGIADAMASQWTCRQTAPAIQSDLFMEAHT